METVTAVGSTRAVLNELLLLLLLRLPCAGGARAETVTAVGSPQAVLNELLLLLLRLPGAGGAGAGGAAVEEALGSWASRHAARALALSLKTRCFSDRAAPLGQRAQPQQLIRPALKAWNL